MIRMARFTVRNGRRRRRGFGFHNAETTSGSLMDWAGLEPAILSEYGPEPYAYANSATSPLDHIPPTGPKARFYTIRIHPEQPMKSFDQLLKVMARLRSSKGCPWDRKQTHQTL